MKGKNLFKKLRYRLQYLPFTRNTLIAVIVTYSGIRLLQAPSVKEQPENATLPFIRIMSAYAGWVLLAFVGLSLISTLGSWLYFLWLYRNGRSKLEITVSGDTRKKGMGAQLLEMTIKLFFENLKLKKLCCEPYALNPAPNKTLEKVGFSFVKEYITVPGSINFEQPVKRWEMTREAYLNRSGRISL